MCLKSNFTKASKGKEKPNYQLRYNDTNYLQDFHVSMREYGSETDLK